MCTFFVIFTLFIFLQGLPSDSFSTENGVMVTRGNRYLNFFLIIYRTGVYNALERATDMFSELLGSWQFIQLSFRREFGEEDIVLSILFQ